MIILERLLKLVLFFGLWFLFFLLVTFIAKLILKVDTMPFGNEYVLFVSFWGFLPSGNVVWGD
jgi:hypothetical protein